MTGAEDQSRPWNGRNSSGALFRGPTPGASLGQADQHQRLHLRRILRLEPFLKECVKPKMVFFGFFLGWCAPVAPWPLASFFVVCRKSGECNRCCFFCFVGVRLGCRRFGKLRSFFSFAIAPNTFLRKTPLTIIREQLCRLIVAADADLSGANSSP